MIEGFISWSIIKIKDGHEESRFWRFKNYLWYRKNLTHFWPRFNVTEVVRNWCQSRQLQPFISQPKIDQFSISRWVLKSSEPEFFKTVIEIENWWRNDPFNHISFDLHNKNSEFLGAVKALILWDCWIFGGFESLLKEFGSFRITQASLQDFSGVLYYAQFNSISF